MNPLKSAALGALALLAAAALPARSVTMDVKIDRPYLTQDKPEDVTLRIRLEAPHGYSRRAPLNLALVLDKSGSMEGLKISRLREAARQALSRLRRDDVLTIIGFSDKAEVLFPTGRYEDGRLAMAALERLQANGGTALYDGVLQGLSSMAEYKGKGRVSRILLLSDGLANIGPSSVPELSELGREAVSRGIPVTTFGFGSDYGEDLMTRLALASDGNHAFIPENGNLARYFDKELGDALAVAARDLIVEITLGPGVRLKRSLDREISENGQILRWKLNQLSAGAPKRLLLQLEAPATALDREQDIASARLVYADPEGTEQPEINAAARATGAGAEKASQRDSELTADAAVAVANLKREEAIQLRDEGRAAEAAQVLRETAQGLQQAKKDTGVSSLGTSAGSYEDEARAMAAPSADWNHDRKTMKAKSYNESTQQAY